MVLRHALVVCTTVSSIRQWIRETLDKTTLTAEELGEWSGERKQLRPVTFATYQSLTWADPSAPPDADMFVRHPHLDLFSQLGWGLVVYDEVHLLPAPVFRAAARVQAVRRLGLTATLVREDGRESDIFSLIGPKRFDLPWTEVESGGWIAPASCVEVRVPLGAVTRAAYASAEPKLRHRVAAYRDINCLRRIVRVERYRLADNADVINSCRASRTACCRAVCSRE